MKSIQIKNFGGPEVLQVTELAELKPAADQLVITVKAIGVNPVDTYIRAGLYGERTFPFTPGMDAAGVVKTVGSEVRRFKPNDKVYVAGSLSGTYAEQVLCNENHVHPLPESTGFEQGAALGVPYATAYYALFHRGHAMPGEILLIHGASGSVGTAAIQLARARGLTIIGTGGTEKGRKLVKDEGAHHVVDHHAPDFSEQIMKLTGGKGVNILLEMLANVNLANDLKLLAARGRVVVVGSRGKIEIDPRDLMSRNADVRGMSLIFTSEQELRGVHMALVAGLETGTLRPVIGQKIPLSEAARAHETVMEAGAYGKIVLIP